MPLPDTPPAPYQGGSAQMPLDLVRPIQVSVVALEIPWETWQRVAPVRLLVEPVRWAARAIRRPRERRSVRRANARGPDDGPEDPSDLAVIPLDAFRRDVDAWLEAVGR